MNIQPLKKELYNRAKALGITNIILRFSGGNDEGFLDVALRPWDQNKSNELDKLTTEVESWAWDNYIYSGAGDGNEFGDDIYYDLEKRTATCQEWQNTRSEGYAETVPLRFEKDEEFK